MNTNNNRNGLPSVEQLLRDAMKGDNQQAVNGLALARAWYRRYPELVTAEEFPAELADAYDGDGDTDLENVEFGCLDPNFPERVRALKVELRRHRDGWTADDVDDVRAMGIEV